VSRPLLVAYRALGLGDFLTGVPALRALARAFPEHRRVLAAPAAIAPLAALSEAVDEVVDCAPLAPLPDDLGGADVAVNLHGRGPQSHELLRAAAPRRLIAFACGEVEGPRWRAGEHEVARWCRLLSEAGIPADPRDLELRAPAVEVPRASRGPPDPSRRRERGTALARRALGGGGARRARRGRAVVITGSPAERSLAERVAAEAGLPPAAVMAGRTDLSELAAIVAAAGRVACADTGVAHLATAFGTHSVVLFGPTPPSEWGPPADRPPHQGALARGHRGSARHRSPIPGFWRSARPRSSPLWTRLRAAPRPVWPPERERRPPTGPAGSILGKRVGVSVSPCSGQVSGTSRAAESGPPRRERASCSASATNVRRAPCQHFSVTRSSRPAARTL
jgi:hypothetical protein